MSRSRGLIKTGMLLLIAVFLSSAAAGAAHKKIKPKRGPVPLNIQSFRVGMTIAQVKELLRKKDIRDYETGFSDLLAYSPAPGSEIKLSFSCSSKASLLSSVQMSTEFATDETEAVLPKFKEKLVAKYGMPHISESQWNALNFCWGKCGQGSTGLKLEARTAGREGNKAALILSLSNERLSETCGEIRHTKINRWLYQWLADVARFRTGMSLKDASVLYQKRFQDKPAVEEERDESSPEAVINFVVRDYDFFAGLDYESFRFEGQGPGAITLKFTGDQAGRNSALNRRLYYASFSTTRFSSDHGYPDVRHKLAALSRLYGQPAVFPLVDGIAAEWRKHAKKIRVSIFDSGLITMEQTDPSLKEAYRDAAVKQIENYARTRFDKQIF